MTHCSYVSRVNPLCIFYIVSFIVYGLPPYKKCLVSLYCGPALISEYKSMPLLLNIKGHVLICDYKGMPFYPNRLFNLNHSKTLNFRL